MRSLSIFWTIFTSLSLVACGGGGGGSAVTAASVTVTCPNGSSRTGSTTEAARAQCPLPQLVKLTPADKATGIDAETTSIIEVAADSDLEATTITSVNVTLRSGATDVPGAVTTVGKRGFSYAPATKLGYAQQYAFAANVKDSIGNPLSISSTFSTKGYTIETSAEKVWELQSTEVAPSYTYAGVTYPEGPITYFPQAMLAYDYWQSGNSGVLVALNKGYASGLDTRITPILLKSDGYRFSDGTAEVQNPLVPIPGLRRTAVIDDGAGKFRGAFGVAHDTGDRKSADAVLLRSGAIPANVTSDLPTLPLSLSNPALGRANAVDAHSMAVGDLNGDGLTDIIIGEWRDPQGPYKLMQTKPGTWVVQSDTFLKTLAFGWPLANPLPDRSNLLTDLHLVDVNSDGFPDLVAGWGHGSTRSYVFINDGRGNFSATNSIPLPTSVYGVDNSLHMKTLSADLNGDGRTDLIVISSKFIDYYAGYAIQILMGDGKGGFADETATRLVSLPGRDHLNDSRLQWSDAFYLIDVNNDGAADIVGADKDGARLWLNSGKGVFTEVAVSNSKLVNTTSIFVKKKDGGVTALSFNMMTTNAPISTRIWFSQRELLYK